MKKDDFYISKKAWKMNATQIMLTYLGTHLHAILTEKASIVLLKSQTEKESFIFHAKARKTN